MADQAVVHIGENSPEQVAFKLMNEIAASEGVNLYAHGEKPATREWILNTFAECLIAVRSPQGRLRNHGA